MQGWNGTNWDQQVGSIEMSGPAVLTFDTETITYTPSQSGGVAYSIF